LPIAPTPAKKKPIKKPATTAAMQSPTAVIQSPSPEVLLKRKRKEGSYTPSEPIKKKRLSLSSEMKELKKASETPDLLNVRVTRNNVY
jgi:hypothetical protein